MLVSVCQALVNIFFSARFRVEGDSMLPSLSHGQSVFVVRTRFKWNRLRRGDVAAFQRPGGIYIKRVVGLPEEDIRIAGGQVYLNGVAMAEAYTQGVAGEEEKVWGSMVKQALKRRDPGFSERYHGFPTFARLLEEAKTRGLLTLELDEKSGGYIIRGYTSDE